MSFSTGSILAHLHHPRIRSRTHPQHTRTHDHYAESVSLYKQCHTRRLHSPRLSLHHCIYTAFLSFTQDLAHRSHCKRWSRSTHGAFLFFFRVPTFLLAGLRMAPFFSSSGFPPFSWPAVLSFYLLRIALLAAPARVHARPLFLSTCYALRCAPRSPARTHARWCTRRRPTDERRDVRSAGVADWKTARGGNTERTLTAAAGPSPCGPYRHALPMRPSLKVRPL